MPPHPGPVAGAATLGTDAGLLTIVGITLCIPVAIVGYLVSRVLKLDKVVLQDSPATEAIEHNQRGSAKATRRRARAWCSP